MRIPESDFEIALLAMCATLLLLTFGAGFLIGTAFYYVVNLLGFA